MWNYLLFLLSTNLNLSTLLIQINKCEWNCQSNDQTLWRTANWKQMWQVEQLYPWELQEAQAEGACLQSTGLGGGGEKGVHIFIASISLCLFNCIILTSHKWLWAGPEAQCKMKMRVPLLKN